MLVDLKNRSTEEELMDHPSVNVEDLKTALSDISRTNRLLGGNAITIKAVHELIETCKNNKEYVIMDLGCGDGKILRKVAESFRKKNIQVRLIGVDINEKSLEYAKELSVSYPEISYIQQNILDLTESKVFCDISICTLTLHHLTNEEIIVFLKRALEASSMGLVINDLQRSKLAYYLFKVFSLFFIKGYIAKNDGLVSIKRGFRKKELLNFAKELGLKRYQIHWKWAFRYRWIIQS